MSAASMVLSAETIQWLEHTVEKYNVSGAAVAVVKFDQEWKSQTWTSGIRNAQADPWTDSSIFPIHSATKLFTGLALGTCMQRDQPTTPNGKKLSWSTKIKDIWPDFEAQDDYLTEHGDIDDFMGMRSGITLHSFARMQSEIPADAYKYVKRDSLGSEPRQLWQYYTNGINMCSEIIHVCTGTPYPDYLLRLLRSMGLKNASVGLTEEMRGSTVDGFLRSGNQGIGEPKPIGWWCDALGPWNQGSGGLMLNLDLAAGISHGGPAPLTLTHTSQFSYVMGMDRAAYRGHDCIGHAGGLDAHGCLFVAVPSKKVALFMSTNDDGRLAPFRVEATYMILDDLLGEARRGSDIPGLDRLVSLPLYSPTFTELHPPDIADTYNNAAYGEMRILAIHLADSSSLAQAVVQAFRWTPFAGTVRLGKWFHASLPGRAFITHTFFEHVSDHTFNVYPAILRHVRDSDDRPTKEMVGSIRGKFTAIFLGEGFGMFGGWIDAGRGAREIGSREGVTEWDIERRAEVYFHKK